MKPYIFTLVVLLLISDGIGGLQAQSMLYVKEKAGNQTAFPIPGIRKLNFTGGNVVVTDTNAGTETFPVSGIRFLSFRNFFTGIQDPGTNQAGKLRLYPNPVNDELIIEYAGDHDGLTIEILDLQGRVLQSHNMDFSKIKLNVTRLEPGIYFSRIHAKSRVFVKKFIKS
jgi:hypothetical protein